MNASPTCRPVRTDLLKSSSYLCLLVALGACGEEPAPTSLGPSGPLGSARAGVAVSTRAGQPGSTVTVAIRAEGADGSGLTATQGYLRFDPARLRYIGQLPESGEVVVVNEQRADMGELRFLAFSARGLTGNTAMFGFEVTGSSYAHSLSVELEAAVGPEGALLSSSGATRSSTFGGVEDPTLSVAGAAQRISRAAWAARLGVPASHRQGPLPIPPAGGYLVGDCSRDASIDVLDALDASRISVGLDLAPVDPSEFRVCDVDDNEVVNVLDVLDIANASVGNEPPMGGPVGVEFRAVSVGESHTCALAATGQAYCWGANANGQLGDSTTTPAHSPRATTGGHKFVQLTLGASHTCALDAAGVAWCWGAGAQGQLGDGAGVDRTTPTAVGGGHDFERIAAGGLHTCGVDEMGAAWCWGANSRGQLGNGTTVASSLPVAVMGAHVFEELASGAAHSCAIDLQGVAYCWGANDDGQLGDGGGPDRPIPTRVLGPHTFVQIATGERHTCGLYSTGTAWCWGGVPPGDGSPGGSVVPVQVSASGALVQLEGGAGHTCAVDSTGQGLCWGANARGELGDGTTVDKMVPVEVSGGHTLGDVSGGGAHTCAIDDIGRALCWGANGFGQVGDGTTIDRWLPVVLAPLGCTASSPGDADADRLPDCAETGTGDFRGSLDAGTDPLDPDTDDDGIIDGDEAMGTILGLDLPSLGVSPLRRDVLIEYDWFDDALECAPHSHRPTAAAVTMVLTAFVASPELNPDGSTGVNVIHDYGQGGALGGGNEIADADGVLSTGVNGAEFAAHKAANFAANRVGYFRYVILPHRYNVSSGSSGQAELVGDDMIVSLFCLGSDVNVAHTIMHELGHNLGLHHGGFEATNWKPNYNSVMNYKYSFPGVDTDCTPPGNGVLDYSRGTRPPLDEVLLSEPQGICGSPPGPAWDWNGDGDFTDVGVVRDINVDAQGFGDGFLFVLRDHDDWGSLTFEGIFLPGGPEGAFASPARSSVATEIVTCTLTPPL